MINLDEVVKKTEKSLTDQGMEVSHTFVMGDVEDSKYSLRFQVLHKGFPMEVLLEGSIEDSIWDMYIVPDGSLKHTFISKMNVLD